MLDGNFVDNLNVKELKEFAREIVPTLGCLMLKKSATKRREIDHTPFSLLPSPVPRHCYDKAVGMQRHFQALLYKVAHDHHFLKNCLQKTIEADDFTGRLWQVYDTVHQQDLINPLSLSLMRIDYMFHNDQQTTATTTTTTTTTSRKTIKKSKTNNNTTNNLSPNNTKHPTNNTKPLPSAYHHLPSNTHLKQVELNTIAASFGGLSQSLTQYYKLVVRKYMDPALVDKIPANRASDGLAEGLIGAWKAYHNPQAIIVFLVGTTEYNVFDQRLLELSVLKCDHKVRLVRSTHEDFRGHSSSDQDRRLFLDGMEVAVVYLRTWYTPEDCEGGWECRLIMERSKAIMCPSVGYQLAGTKKVQQMLCKKGVLERWVEDGEVLDHMRQLFAAQYSLDHGEAEAETGIEMALKDPDKFVVKPQREGGGNNYYNEDVRTLLQKIRHSKERSGYILMEKIKPLVIKNVPMLAAHDDDDKEDGGHGNDDGGAVKAGKSSEFVPMVSELGIYGYLIGKQGKVIENKQVGHLLRTKRVGVDEGGVATGYSVLDSPFLVD